MTLRVAPYVDNRSALRYQALVATQGYYAENLQRATIQSPTIMINQSIYYMPIGLLAGDVVTNVIVDVQVGGSGFTGVGVKVGLCTKAGVQLAASADVSASFGSAGVKTLAMSSAYTVLTSDAYLVELLCVITPGTMPTLWRGIGNTGGNTLVTGATLGSHGVQTAQTDFPAPGVPTYNSTVNLCYWVGVS